MFKEVAFDPCCLGNFEYYSLLRQNFGFGFHHPRAERPFAAHLEGCGAVLQRRHLHQPHL